MVKDCELLAERQDLELQGCPVSNGSSQAMEQGNEYGSHAANAMPVRAETSMDSGTDGLFNRDRLSIRLAATSDPGLKKELQYQY